MRKKCVTCAYYQCEEITQGYVCVNGDNKRVSDWVNPHDRCEQWVQSDFSKHIERTSRRKVNIQFIIDTYGCKSQEDMAIEEMSELQKAILKNRRNSDDETKSAIIDEIADVEIMLEQLKIIFSCTKQVEKRIDYKINRQINRILKNYGIEGKNGTLGEMPKM